MQKRASFDAAELSDEVGETPVSDSGLAAVSHLGIACVEAYRGEDECGGGRGADNGALAWPAATAELGQQWRRGGGCCCCSRERRRRRERGGDRMGVPGAAGRRTDWDKPVGRATASMTPTYDRHVAGVRWTKAGVRARERGEAGRASNACPLFLFF